MLPIENQVQAVIALLKRTPNLQTLGIYVMMRKTMQDTLVEKEYWQPQHTLDHLKLLKIESLQGTDSEFRLLRHLFENGLSRFHEIEFSFPRLREIVYSGNPPVIREETLSCLSNAAFEFASPPKDFNGIDRNLIECRAFEILERVRNVKKLALEGLYIEFLTRHQELLARLPTSCAIVKHLKLDLYLDKKPVEVVVGTLFTHHQKCIVVDTQASGNNRKITAFIGGLDLCDGHYDTPEHRLFRDLDSVFANDFHNPTFPISADNLTK
ncbi:hypothetical protein IFM89_030384 [Coptis chinensis]|uniref:phospholipase D n=1 Tax=Coptis chinensis TaxID=261450 RepID=A0A835H1J5_9MAGN|nr:hypothetical protein IFM89_030384 [Coptis chinensis]